MENDHWSYQNKSLSFGFKWFFLSKSLQINYSKNCNFKLKLIWNYEKIFVYIMEIHSCWWSWFFFKLSFQFWMDDSFLRQYQWMRAAAFYHIWFSRERMHTARKLVYLDKVCLFISKFKASVDLPCRSSDIPRRTTSVAILPWSSAVTDRANVLYLLQHWCWSQRLRKYD